jgi:hypothetical protein
MVIPKFHCFIPQISLVVTFQYYPDKSRATNECELIKDQPKASMKKKYIWAAAAVLVALVGTWAGNMLWRAHRNLVTLHVRNASLAEVIRKIERQTWEHISVDPKLNSLNSLVTLNVRNKPLPEVLDRIGQQCGARWTTVYAVYALKSALPTLESALFGDTKLEDIGWKTIAPAALDSDGTPGGGGAQPPFVVNGGSLPSPQDLPAGALVSTEDSVIKAGSGPGPEGAQIHGHQRQGAPVMVTIRKRADGSGAVEQEIWTPRQLVLESRLSPRLGENYTTSPTGEGAIQTATQVKGKWKTYYALKKSSIPINLAATSRMRNFASNEPGKAIQMATQDGTNSVAHLKQGGPSIDDIVQSIQRQKLENLARLTPEQRVLRAREEKQRMP